MHFLVKLAIGIGEKLYLVLYKLTVNDKLWVQSAINCNKMVK